LRKKQTQIISNVFLIKKMKKNSKGFTLIELLVVVAIIGILASVVLASLNSARSKGTDAAIKSNLSNTRAQAAIYYDTANFYALSGTTTTAASNTVCTQSTSVFDSAQTNNIAGMVVAAEKAYNNTSTSGTCGIAAGGIAWAVYVPTKSPTSPATGFCVDSTGTAKEDTIITGNNSVCP